MSYVMTYELRSPIPEPGGHFHRSRTLRSFFDRSGMCMAYLDTGLRLIEVNADFTRQFGRTHAELNGSRFRDLLHPAVQDNVARQLSQLLAGRLPRFTEPGVLFHQRDAAVFSGELTALGVHGDAGLHHLLVRIQPARPEQPGQPGKEPALSQPSAGRGVLLADVDARILEGVAAGVSTIKLASMLYLSRGGVEYHVNVLMRKLKVKNRPALVSKAYSMGLLCPGWPPRVHPDHVKK